MSKIIELTTTRGGRWACLVVVNSRKGNSIFTRHFVKHKKKPTDNQVNARRKFMLASRYARNVLQNPDMLAAYSAKARQGLTPYIVAVTDFLKPPFVDQIDVSGYTGNPGDKISVTAGDDFEVASVFVKILTPAGVLIEQGACVFNLVTGYYEFTVTVQVPDLTGVTISATATDMPGHSDQLSVTL